MYRALLVLAALPILVLGWGGLFYALYRLRNRRSDGESAVQPIVPPGHTLAPTFGTADSERLSEVESGFRRLERDFSDLHNTVEVRHRSVMGLISKKLGPSLRNGRGGAPPPLDEEEEAAETTADALPGLFGAMQAAAVPPVPPIIPPPPGAPAPQNGHGTRRALRPMR